ncbi:Uncharacterised protein [Mycobacteroides abscessus subsp. massiliense]|nr:Uncharacterised protein [Mycobacteroides abscessus subsp. massiliense]
MIERQEAGPVNASDDALRGVRTGSRHHIGQAGQCVGGRQGLDAALLQSRTGFRVSHARRPGTEIDAGSGDALLTQPPSEPVEKGVRRAVRGLSITTPYRGNGRGVDEEVELQPSGSLTQIPCAPNLTGENAIYFGIV